MGICTRKLVAGTVLAWALGASVPAAAQEAALVGVDEVTAEPLVQTIPVIGRLVARLTGTVATRINGPVEEVVADVGDRVAEGDLIARLDTDTLSAQRDLAVARLGEAEASLDTSKAELELAGQEVARLERLKNSAATTRASIDDARQERIIAAARVSEVEAAVAAAQAELHLAEINLQHAQVRAPYSGVVTQRLTEAGSYVQTGQAILRMISDEQLELEADVPFERLSGLTPGARVDVELADGTRHEAVVRAVIPEENPLTRTRAVRFMPQFGQTLNPLAVEQSATVLVPVGAPREIVSVHKDAILRQPSGDIVYVVENETALPRPIRLGEPVGNRMEVIEGLEPGERVVVRGNERLIPNQPVKVMPTT